MNFSMYLLCALGQEIFWFRARVKKNTLKGFTNFFYNKNSKNIQRHIFILYSLFKRVQTKLNVFFELVCFYRGNLQTVRNR